MNIEQTVRGDLKAKVFIVIKKFNVLHSSNYLDGFYIALT